MRRRFGVQNDPVQAYSRLARILQRGENFDRSIELLQQAAHLYSAAQHIDKQCRSLQKAAEILDADLNNPAAALARLDKALAALPDSDLRIQLLLHKSKIYSRLLLLSKAFSPAQRADSLCRASGDSSLLPRCDLRTAEVLFQKRDLKLALDRCNTLSTYQNSDAKIKSLMLKSKIFSEQHNSSAAINAAQRAYERARETGDIQLTAAARFQFAIILWRQKEYAGAAALLQNAPAEAASSRKERLRSNLVLGALLLDAGETAAAKMHLDTAQQISGELNDLRTFATARLLLSRCQTETSRAHDEADAAIALAKTARLHDVLWRAHLQKAQFYADNGEIDKAHSEFAAALAQLEAAELATAIHHFQLALSTSEDDFFATFISFLIKAGMPEEALGVIEKQKQRAYRYFVADRIESIPARYRKWPTTYDSVREDYAMARAQAVAAWSLKKAAAASDASLQTAAKSIDSFRLQLKTSAPRLYPRYFDEALDIDSLQRSLPDSSGIVAFYRTKETLYTWPIDAAGVEFRHSQTGGERIKKSGRHLLATLQRRQPTNGPATELYKLLISPWEQKLATWKQMTIIPDEALRDIPFAALQSDSAEYLGLNYNISYALQLASPGDNPHPLADSINAAVFCTRVTETDTTSAYAALLGSSLERYFDNSRFYNDDLPLSEQFSDAASNYSIMYWGCMWEQNAAFPFHSTLRRTSDNSTLNCRDILATSWDADIAIIYAVSSRKNSTGTLTELPNCFLKNGARFLLAPTQAPADDLTAAVLLKRFFRNIAAGQTPTQALRQAQQWVHDRLNPQPAYWAGWRLYRNFQPSSF